MQKKLKIAIIGLGNQGKKHFDAIKTIEKKGKVQLVGICDINSKISGIPVYSDYKRLLAETKPDVVLISTPNYLHKQIVVDALKRKIDVIKEKPLAMSYVDAREMLQAAIEHNSQLITLQQRFYSPLFIKAKKTISSLGKIVSFSYRFTLNDNKNSWYWDLEKAGGGSWLNMGWHAVSVVQWLIGDTTRISLDWKINNKREWDYKTDHSSLAKVEVGKNIVGFLFLSCAFPKKEESLKVVCKKGIVYLSRNELKVYSFAKKRIISEYKDYSEENEIYFAQLADTIKKINNKKDYLLRDLEKVKIIQAGINSAGNHSAPFQITKIDQSSNYRNN